MLDIIKKISLLLIIQFATFSNVYSQVLPTRLTESNPHRGIYVDRFFYIDPIAWNNHTQGTPWNPNVLHPEFSMLGTDINHDGIFEKEDEFLNYCRDNHFTYIILLDMHRILGSGISLWNENTGRMEDIELHLCRFMNKAREQYCIDEIAGAGENTHGFQEEVNYNDVYRRATAPIIIPSVERMAPNFNPIWTVIEDSTLVPGDSAFLGSETLKMLYRIIHLNECHECNTYFNFIFIEYEFWQNSSDDYIDSAHGFFADATCKDSLLDCNNIYTICQPGHYPNWSSARYLGHFVPVVRAMRSMVDIYNSLHSYTPTNPRSLRIDGYVDPSIFETNFSSTGLNEYIYAAFLDGLSQDSLLFPSPPSNCQPPNNYTQRMLDRVSMYNYYHYSPPNIPVIDTPQFQFLSDNLNDFNFHQHSPSWGETKPLTDVHPILSAESISDYGYDDYWGPWFAENKINTIFKAERLYFRQYDKHQYWLGSHVLNDGENSVQRGGVLWYAQSHMIHQLAHPKIFIADISSCYTSAPDSIHFQYIGPSEAPLNIDFRITDTTGNTHYFPSSGWNTTVTDAIWSNYTHAAPDNVAPGLPLNTTMLAEMRVYYPGGCSYSYSERFILSGNASIQAYGPLEFCEGGNVTLHANADSGTVQWYHNNIPIPAPQGQQLDIIATNSGEYTCSIQGCGITPTPIIVNVL